jgi:hypothetical protein
MAQPGKVIISFIGSPNIRLRDNVAVAFRVKIFKAFGQLTVWDEHPLTTRT